LSQPVPPADAEGDAKVARRRPSPRLREDDMAGLGLMRSLWHSRFSKPAGERVILRHALATPPRRILELGLGTLVRTERLLEVVGAAVPTGEIQYVGIDRFESRAPTDPPGVTLKQAHRRLHALARVQLVPGNIDSALARVTNHIGTFDLILISADNDERHLSRSWFFLQRLSTPRTTTFVETTRTGASVWSEMPRMRLDELAAKSVLLRAG
jgi:hypothetical protein